MAYIANNKYKEIRDAAKGGNEKALKVLQAMRKMSPQADIDLLVNDYYKVEELPAEEVAEPVEVDETVSTVSTPTPALDVVEELPETKVIDLTEILDKELEGLYDENEINSMSFGDYINNSKKDTLRQLKNNDYFKAYDTEARQKYSTDKVNAYKKKFDTRLKDIERDYNDKNVSLDGYIKTADLMLDDDKEYDFEQMKKAYNDFTDNETVMHSFGRHWDESDNQVMTQALQELVNYYGKKNVMAVLNTLKADNEKYKEYSVNQIDAEISRFAKSIDNLLK